MPLGASLNIRAHIGRAPPSNNAKVHLSHARVRISIRPCFRSSENEPLEFLDGLGSEPLKTILAEWDVSHCRSKWAVSKLWWLGQLKPKTKRRIPRTQ